LSGLTDRVPVLEMVGVSKRFDATQALGGVSLALYPGEVHALVGENGAGKSTLIKVMTGVHPADEGAILVGGEQVTLRSSADAQRHGIAAIYQEPTIYPDLNVAENIFMGHRDRAVWARSLVGRETGRGWLLLRGRRPLRLGAEHEGDVQVRLGDLSPRAVLLWPVQCEPRRRPDTKMIGGHAVDLDVGSEWFAGYCLPKAPMEVHVYDSDGAFGRAVIKGLQVRNVRHASHLVATTSCPERCQPRRSSPSCQSLMAGTTTLPTIRWLSPPARRSSAVPGSEVITTIRSRSGITSMSCPPSPIAAKA